MKTLMTFFAGAVVTAFTILNANAQGNKQNYSGSYEDQNLWHECLNETISGSVEYSFTWWEHGKFQNKVKGTYTGDVTGEIYTFSMVSNSMFKFTGKGAFTLTDIGKYTWKREHGGILSSGHHVYHLTFNDNGGHFVNNLVPAECNGE